MLDREDLRRVGAQYGAADEQVRLDHLIAHTLRALAEAGPDLRDLVFFGGTALAWTYLPGRRLSEDIDLMLPGRSRGAEIIERIVPPALSREFPRIRWSPPPTGVRHAVTPARLVTEDGLVLRVQVLDMGAQGWSWVPKEQRRLVQRYRDVEAPTMFVPTAAGAAAMKCVAWADRHAARDLFDLAGLGEIGALGVEAANLFHHATGRDLAPHDFELHPMPDWVTALGHQTRLLVPAEECLDSVRESFAACLGW